ncbi:MAG: hypothetical protein ACYSU4_04230 [Planctomycetota bacterium]
MANFYSICAIEDGGGIVGYNQGKVLNCYSIRSRAVYSNNNSHGNRGHGFPPFGVVTGYFSQA